MWYGLLGIPSIYDVFDVLFTKAVLRTIFRKAVFGINDKDTLTVILVFLVDDYDGSRNTCTKENIWRYGAQNEAYMSRSADKCVRCLCFNELGVCG